MFNVANVNAALQLAHTEADADADFVMYEFSCNLQVLCAGDGTEDVAEGDTATINSITVLEYSTGYCDITVALAEEDMLIYADSAFAQVVSNLLNTKVDYTEGGMQDDGLVSMEA